MKRAIFVLSVLFVLSINLFAQEKGVTTLQSDKDKSAPAQPAKQEIKRVEQPKQEDAVEKKVESVPAIGTPLVEKSAPHPLGKSEPLSERKEYEPEFSGLFLWTILVLGMIIGCYFMFRKFISGSRFFGAFNVINILAKKQISSKHTIYLVEIGKKVILLGATKDGITPLSEFTNPDEVAVIRAKCPVRRSDSEEQIFNQQLDENLSKYEKKDAEARDTSGFDQALGEMKKTVDNWKAE